MTTRAKALISMGRRVTSKNSNQMIPWWQVNFGPEAAAAAALEISSGRLSMGKTTRNFEEQVCEKLNVKYCVTTSSGSSALLMAFLASGMKPGDHVAIQDRSWISPAHVAHLLSLSILLVDVKPDRPVIDFTHFLKVIRRKPKVVVIVHMNGRSENLKEIADICATEGIFLIEDAAQAIGSKNGQGFLGTFGDIGCFSLAISKTVSSGQGGFCVTNNPILYEKLLHLRTHGVGNVFEPTWSEFGMNFRYTDPQASIALNQLTKLESRIKKQHENRFIYTDTLKNLRDIKFLQMNRSEGESGPYFDAWTHNGAEVAERMKRLGVECRRFYPSIASANYLNVSNRDEIVNAVKWHEHGIVFPSGPELTLNQLTQVTETVIQEFK